MGGPTTALLLPPEPEGGAEEVEEELIRWRTLNDAAGGDGEPCWT